jgi:hypothetical protein
MILTNRLNLPRSIVNAVRRDPYDRGDAHISVTGLIGPARKRAIEMAHADEITEDVAERIWALLGQITHGILERADEGSLTEERLFIERHGWRISGQFDRYVLEGRLLQDYKLTSVYSVKDGVKAEWAAQTNIYALLLREHGYPVTDLEIVAILRDWQKAKAKHDPEHYPQQPAVVLKVEAWPKKQIETYITDRLLAHGWAQHELPECTAEERWERPAVYVITKKGNSRATSVHPTLEDAEKALALRSAVNYSITERPAEQRRCQDYCPALPFCEQGQGLLKQIEESRLAKLWTVAPPRAPAANEEG